ncbi:MAG: helix-turn-helix transcriptional regulator [Candidatus Omnitrophota bacterium]
MKKPVVKYNNSNKILYCQEKKMLAKNIKKYRKIKDLSQDKLSKLANVTYNTLIKIESGANKNPTLKTLQKLAKALDVTINDLLK